MTNWIIFHKSRVMRYQTIMTELEEYCARTGGKPSTVCVKALNDSRYPKRHARRIEVLERDAQKLAAFMEAHPPKSEEGTT